MLSRQLFDPAVTSHADVDRLLRTEPQVQLTPFVLNNHSNDFKSHCTFLSTARGAHDCMRDSAKTGKTSEGNGAFLPLGGASG
jgi:hypothetical protein